MSVGRYVSKIRLALILLAFVVMVTACGLIPYRTARNAPICTETVGAGAASPLARNCKLMGTAADITRYPVSRAREEFAPGDKDVPPVFVGLALSGGGSRAANFAMATMEQLEALGLMRHVTAISSTSGGGVAGAYYALRGPDLDWHEAQEAMGTNFRSKWVISSLLPHHLARTLFTHEDRSDLMADIFDDQLFKGATYNDLGPLRPGRPIFLATATDAMRGSRFLFSHETFRSQLRSRLDTYPISQAVIASAAFPGAFNTVTLRRYPLPAVPKPSGMEQTPVPIGYEHLLDGGPADNLGIEALLQLAASHHRNRSSWSGTPWRKTGCFLFVVDAYSEGISGRKSWDPNPRGVIDYTVDLNFLDAVDALLIRRRQDLLGYVGLGQGTTSAGGTYIGDVIGPMRGKGLYSVSFRPASQLVQFDVPTSMSKAGHPWSLIRPVLREQLSLKEISARLRDGTLGAPPVPDGHFRCTAWHLNLNGLMSVKPYVGETGNEPQRLRNDESGWASPLIEHRAKLNWVVTQTDTDFKLAGPPNCSAKLLQDALYAAAFVTVREDHYNRPKVCEWFETQGLPVSPECRTFLGNKSLDVALNLKTNSTEIAGRAGDSAVACTND
jgi:NTE family protein